VDDESTGHSSSVRRHQKPRVSPSCPWPKIGLEISPPIVYTHVHTQLPRSLAIQQFLHPRHLPIGPSVRCGCAHWLPPCSKLLAPSCFLSPSQKSREIHTRAPTPQLSPSDGAQTDPPTVPRLLGALCPFASWGANGVRPVHELAHFAPTNDAKCSRPHPEKTLSSSKGSRNRHEK
jgi:hypothetical protein